jgi:hypothetical protein
MGTIFCLPVMSPVCFTEGYPLCWPEAEIELGVTSRKELLPLDTRPSTYSVFHCLPCCLAQLSSKAASDPLHLEGSHLYPDILMGEWKGKRET